MSNNLFRFPQARLCQASPDRGGCVPLSGISSSIALDFPGHVTKGSTCRRLKENCPFKGRAYLLDLLAKVQVFSSQDSDMGTLPTYIHCINGKQHNTNIIPPGNQTLRCTHIRTYPNKPPPATLPHLKSRLAPCQTLRPPLEHLSTPCQKKALQLRHRV